MIIVKFKSLLGHEGVLIEGRNDDVFLVYPEIRDEDGNSDTRMLSRKAIIEMADKLREKE